MIWFPLCVNSNSFNFFSAGPASTLPVEDENLEPWQGHTSISFCCLVIRQPRCVHVDDRIFILSPFLTVIILSDRRVPCGMESILICIVRFSRCETVLRVMTNQAPAKGAMSKTPSALMNFFLDISVPLANSFKHRSK